MCVHSEFFFQKLDRIIERPFDRGGRQPLQGRRETRFIQNL
jgi:hypothetical protein